MLHLAKTKQKATPQDPEIIKISSSMTNFITQSKIQKTVPSMIVAVNLGMQQSVITVIEIKTLQESGQYPI